MHLSRVFQRLSRTNVLSADVVDYRVGIAPVADERRPREKTKIRLAALNKAEARIAAFERVYLANAGRQICAGQMRLEADKLRPLLRHLPGMFIDKFCQYTTAAGSIDSDRSKYVDRRAINVSDPDAAYRLVFNDEAGNTGLLQNLSPACPGGLEKYSVHPCAA